MIKFNVGQTYSARHICDHDSIESFTILSRTDKSVYVDVGGHKNARKGIRVYNGVEQFLPRGSYSMCMIVSADDKDLSK